MPTTTYAGWPYPALSDAPNGPQQIGALAAAIDTSIAAPWTSYTPAWTATSTNPTLGNGTLVGAYRQVGKTVDVRVTLTIGSTSTAGSGVYRLSLPVAPKVECLLNALMIDLSASSTPYPMLARVFANLTSGDNMRVAIASGAGVWGATLPVAPASGDIITLSGTYEAA